MQDSMPCGEDSRLQSCRTVPNCAVSGRDPALFVSTEYPCVYRETRVLKDDRQHYIDPFANLIVKDDGRRLMYDASHPDMIYASQYSSELADPPGPYSFPAPTGLSPEIPWTKDLHWQVPAASVAIIKAPYSGTEIGVFMFLSGRKFPRNRRFLSYSAKTGSAGADRFRGKSYVPPALSNGICVRAIGLPVWAGHRRVCLFLFFHFVRTDFAHA